MWFDILSCVSALDFRLVSYVFLFFHVRVRMRTLVHARARALVRVRALNCRLAACVRFVNMYFYARVSESSMLASVLCVMRIPW